MKLHPNKRARKSHQVNLLNLSSKKKRKQLPLRLNANVYTVLATKERRSAISVSKAGMEFSVMCQINSKLPRWSKMIMSSCSPSKESWTKKWTRRTCLFLNSQGLREMNLKIRRISTRLRRSCSVIRSLHRTSSYLRGKTVKKRAALLSMNSSRTKLWLESPSWA